MYPTTKSGNRLRLHTPTALITRDYIACCIGPPRATYSRLLPNRAKKLNTGVNGSRQRPMCRFEPKMPWMKARPQAHSATTVKIVREYSPPNSGKINQKKTGHQFNHWPNSLLVCMGLEVFGYTYHGTQHESWYVCILRHIRLAVAIIQSTETQRKKLIVDSSLKKKNGTMRPTKMNG
jgi:hypothetical protein